MSVVFQKQEELEKKEEEEAGKKQMKAKKVEKGRGGRQMKLTAMAETRPSPMGRRIEPRIDQVLT